MLCFDPNFPCSRRRETFSDKNLEIHNPFVKTHTPTGPLAPPLFDPCNGHSFCLKMLEMAFVAIHTTHPFSDLYF